METIHVSHWGLCKEHDSSKLEIKMFFNKNWDHKIESFWNTGIIVKALAQQNILPTTNVGMNIWSSQVMIALTFKRL